MRKLLKCISDFQYGSLGLKYVVFHIETSHLICFTNQMTGFYMKCNLDKVTLALTPSEVS